MKKFLTTAILAATLALPLQAQETKRPELTPSQKLNVANGVTALVIGPVFLPAALATGQAEGLCNLLGGKYTPNSDGKDQCPGGLWLRAIPYVKGLIND